MVTSACPGVLWCVVVCWCVAGDVVVEVGVLVRWWSGLVVKDAMIAV